MDQGRVLVGGRGQRVSLARVPQAPGGLAARGRGQAKLEAGLLPDPPSPHPTLTHALAQRILS